LVRRIIGGTREEDARHFSGKMKKMLFSLEKKEKKCNFALEGSKRPCASLYGQSRLTPLFYKKTLKRARKSAVDNIGVCEKRTLSLER
jgi:hypothetical protein